MTLNINGVSVTASADKTLGQILKDASLDSPLLSERPLAAQMAGEIFTLNYIPVRSTAPDTERSSVRRAVRSSGGKVRLLTYSDRSGMEVYVRTICFLVGLAFHQLWPLGEIAVSCTIGESLYYRVSGCEDFSAERLKSEIVSFIQKDIPFTRRRRQTDAAADSYRRIGREDKVRLLSWRTAETYEDYYYGDYADYFCGEMLPSAGYATVWDLIPETGGFLVLLPSVHDPDKISNRPEGALFFDTFRQGEQWSELMACHTIPDLNELVYSGEIRDLIRVNEALHERRFAQISENIITRKAQIVLLAGPSSSGKTTSANRLAVQLKASGKKPLLISLDDYYREREELVQESADGTIDLEHIHALDIAMFRKHMDDLLKGESVTLPEFDFASGKRKWRTNKEALSQDSVIIVEGLHALNPELLSNNVKDKVFRLFVSPLLPLNLDYTNRIPTSSLRLLRRIVRDCRTRGVTVRDTMNMWHSVQAGEKRWIFPYQNQADAFFNSSTLYELSVLKRAVFPLLIDIGPEESCYEEIRAIVKILNYVREADAESEIPPTSIVREFIGGNTFYT